MSSGKTKNPKAGGGLKQGSLFSFFTRQPSKKATTAKTTAATSSRDSSPASTSKDKQKPVGTEHSARKPAASSSPIGNSNNYSNSNGSETSSGLMRGPSASPSMSSGSLSKWEKIRLGTRIAVLWPDDKKFYAAVVKDERNNRSNFFLEYDDGETEWIDLRKETFRFIDDDAEVEFNDDDDDEGSLDEEVSGRSCKQTDHPKKRRKIHDSDDEEFEFDMDEALESDDEFFGDVEEEAEDDDFIVSDGEDEEGSPRKKKGATTNLKTKVIPHESNANPATTPQVFKKTAAGENGTPAVTPKSLASFSAYNNTSHTCAPKRVTPPSSARLKASSIALASNCNTDGGHKALPYVHGAVNVAGAHVHNHLHFLQNPRDARGRRKGEPGYDPRTLMIDKKELFKHNANGKSWSPGVQQWWETKAQYFDAVLLFKTGKFYEMFHMDADIGVQVLGFQYMKGHIAHAGFPEVSYGVMADKLVKAGLKVVRVEQCETPDDLKKRKKETTGKKPQVVAREVCSVLTVGTRTHCFLDKEYVDSVELTGDGHGHGPLVAIREVLLDSTEQWPEEKECNNGVRPVCEYGITVVDAPTAKVTIGQFADDVLRSRMTTLLATFSPSEILVEGGADGASPTLRALLKNVQTTSMFRLEEINPIESFPKSTAVDANVRRKLDRGNGTVKPWDVNETLEQFHLREYFPKGSRMEQGSMSISRWPHVLRAAIDGEANLALSSLGAALFYLQRNLIDEEIFSMSHVYPYIPPITSVASEGKFYANNNEIDVERLTESDDLSPNEEAGVTHMSLDGNTLCHLEILTNSVDHKASGSLWSKINFSKTPHGARLLRAWLLRPLFKKAEIDRRADAVDELHSGQMALAMDEAKLILAKVGDIERLLARVHAMSGKKLPEDQESASCHPNTRAVYFEEKKNIKRMVNDFSKLLNGLKFACQIPSLFDTIEISSPLLKKIVQISTDAESIGCFPDVLEDIEWFFGVVDLERAASGDFEPERGVDEIFDAACEEIDMIHSQLDAYKERMCSSVLTPRHLASSRWKYVNTQPDSKDKFTVELPNSVSVPPAFKMIGKRGKGDKQVNKYRTYEIEQLVVQLERAYAVHKECKAHFLQNVFSKFDAKRSFWAAIAQCTALLDALGSLAELGKKPGYCRPKILDCPPGASPCLNIVKGRHPCVEKTHCCNDFIPNDLELGSKEVGRASPLVLLLSGPNMGGKSTLIRQTALVCILAQIGGFVPATECELTPVDKIMTRLGASDRILVGQSTFMVELSETAGALRGATRRSMVLLDELGRGTSSFDGTAIASACLSYISNSLKCLCLFSTHHHQILDERKDDPNIRLGHMESIVETHEEDGKENVTFLYTLGDGPCPKSFGINVARLAQLPEAVCRNAKRISMELEQELSGNVSHTQVSPEVAIEYKAQLLSLISEGSNSLVGVEDMWKKLQQS